MTKKKSSFGRFIFILIILLILIFGGYFGYQYYYKKEKPNIKELQSLLLRLNPETEKEFPIAGIWYLDNPNISAEYIFEAPEKSDGKLAGKLDVVTDKMTTGVFNYEVIGDNKLKISDPKNTVTPYEITYNYNATEQKLVITNGAEKKIYTRNAPVAARKTEEIEQKSPQQILLEKMEQIAGEWNIETLPGWLEKYSLKFSKPVLQDGKVKGEFQNLRITPEQPKNGMPKREEIGYYNYELISDGELKLHMTKLLVNGKEGFNDGTHSGTAKFELLDNGNTLIFNDKYVR